MRDAASLQRYLHGRYVLGGYARRVEVLQDLNLDGLRVEIYLHDSRALAYMLTGHEIYMDGERAFQYWLQRIDEEVRRYARESGGERIQVMYGYTTLNPQVMGVDWATGHDPKAIQKAKDLFKLACGKKAFDTLDAGKPLAITGSKGTKYTLHNRATYCIERVKDGAKLCAVVPNVPLFDHLLGIKLMVEYDEPAFLKTANVSGGRTMQFSTVSDYTRW